MGWQKYQSLGENSLTLLSMEWDFLSITDEVSPSGWIKTRISSSAGKSGALKHSKNFGTEKKEIPGMDDRSRKKFTKPESKQKRPDQT